MSYAAMHPVGVALVVVGLAALGIYTLLHRRLMRWGATDAEVAARFPGDERVEQPSYVTTRAVTIRARPSEIWPWLAQMGFRRGGLYSYDWLDRLFGYLDRPSAEEVLPEFQELEAGSMIPVGRGPSWPVAIVERERALVLEPLEGVITWSFVLVPIDARRTRLITRVRHRVPPTIMGFVMYVSIDPAAFVMTRKMLLGIKRRAEALALRREATERASPAVRATPRELAARGPAVTPLGGDVRSTR
jgi:hypothetical protein